MDRRRWGLLDVLLLLLVLVGAAVTRAAYLNACADNGSGPGPLRVQDPPPVLTGLPADTEMRGHTPPTELDALVTNLTEHHWFGCLAPFAPAEETTAHTAPGYPWLLSLLERAHVEMGSVDRAVRWIQCGLGALTAVLYFLFARWAFRDYSVALLAGLLCAVHPFWIINTAAIDDGVLTTFLLAAALYLGTKGGQTAGPFTSLLYGLALAGLALLRAALLPFAFAAILWFLFRSRRLPHGWRSAILAFLGFIIGLVPWGLRNYQVFGEPMPIVDSAVLHVWMGNNPRATGGPQSEPAMLEALADARGQDAGQLAEELGRMPQPERYNSLGNDVVREVTSNPAGFWQRRLWAGLYFFFGERWFKDQRLWEEDPSAQETLPPQFANSYPAFLYGSLFGMLLLGVLGWRWTHGWRFRAMPSSLALMWIPLPYILGHAEALSGPRLPLDGVLLCYAAFALVGLIPSVGRVVLEGPGAEPEFTRGPRARADVRP